MGLFAAKGSSFDKKQYRMKFGTRGAVFMEQTSVVSVSLEALENMRDAFYMLDCHGTILFMNKTAREKSGGCAVGRSIYTVFPELRTNDFNGEFAQAISEGRLFHRELKSTGYAKWLDMRLYPAQDGAALFIKEIGSYLSNSEIDRIARRDLIGQMAAGLAHELRNPLTVIDGYLQFLQGKSLEEVRSRFDIISKEVRKIEYIVSSFLSLSKHKVVLKRPCDLNMVVRSVLPIIRADAGGRGVKIRCRLGRKLPEMLLNEEEIRELILSLARNGLEAMNLGGKLTIMTSYKSGEVTLAVDDNGQGIMPEDMGRIFEPFYTKKEDAVGLGLPISASIAERHNAKLQVVSVPQSGTCVTVLFSID